MYYLYSDKTDQEMEVMKAQREYRDASNRLHAMTTRCTAAEKVREGGREGERERRA